MTRPPFDLALTSLCLLAAGCAGDEPPTHVASPDTTLPLALLLELDGEALRLVRGPFRFPTEPLLWSGGEDSSLVLAGLGAEALRALHPRLDVERAPEGYTLVTEAEACEHGRTLGEGRRSFSLPAEELELVKLHGPAGDQELAALRARLGGWSLEAPLDTSTCESNKPTAAPFGAELEALSPGTVIDGVARHPSNIEDQAPFFELRSAGTTPANFSGIASAFSSLRHQSRGFEST